MVKIRDLKLGQEFYFNGNRSVIYMFLEFTYKKNGVTIQAAKCVIPGKLRPIYISAKHSVNVLKTAVI